MICLFIDVGWFLKKLAVCLFIVGGWYLKKSAVCLFVYCCGLVSEKIHCLFVCLLLWAGACSGSSSNPSYLILNSLFVNYFRNFRVNHVSYFISGGGWF